MTEHGSQSFSPELALVDPAAAEQGRDELPEVVLTEDAKPQSRVEEPPVAGRRRLPWALVCVVVLAVGAGVAIRLGSGHGGRATTPTVAARTIPDFVWVPAASAARYRIEFVRNGDVVLQKTTTAPRFQLAASSLPAGTYRWRVWALGADGSPLGSALVDAAVDLG